MEDLDAACADAMQHQLAGRLDQAEGLYRAILRAAPAHAAANYCIGMLELQRRQPAAGLPHLLAALEAKPESFDYWLGYLEALLHAGRLDEARSTLTLGLKHGLAGAAVDDFEQRLEARFAAEATGAATQRDSAPARPPSRAERRSAALLLRKQEKSLLSLVERRQFSDAQELARSVTERFPERGLGWKVLGTLMSAQGRYQDALAPLEHAVRLLPDDAEARVNLAMNLFRLEQLDQAEAHLEAAIAQKPDLSSAHFRLAMLLAFRNRYAESEESLRRGFALNADYIPGDLDNSFSNLVFLASHNAAVDADELFAMHCRAGDHLEERFRKSRPPHTNDRDPDRMLRVGFVSSDLNNHSVAFFIDPVLAHLAAETSLELHAYYNNTIEDGTSARLRTYFRQWHAVVNLEHEALARKIVDDRIDILIDLCGHTGENRLPVFARKPAPIQLSWLGYPGTTGLRAMDYYLADRHFLPPGRFDRHFREKIVRLPANWPVRSLDAAPPVNPLPALTAKSLCFGSFNRLGKLNPETIDLWCRVLSALPDARMLIGAVDGREQWLLDQFATRGIDRRRLTLQPKCSMADYLELHHQVDICLDTYPYTGGTTTVHALSMGVPTLTVAGPTPGSRQSAGILGQLGLDEFVAADAEELTSKARSWAVRLEDLALLREGIRERWRRSPAGHPELTAAALTRGLREMWKRWCAGRSPESFEAGQG